MTEYILVRALLCVCGVAVCRRRAENKRLLPLVRGVMRRAADHELATLRELPSVTVQTTNALYVHKYDTTTASATHKCTIVTLPRGRCGGTLHCQYRKLN